jgi:Tol biopolymer transport system component
MIKAIIMTICFFCFFSCSQDDYQARQSTQFSELNGPYLGQTPPGKDPELFAPGAISTGLYTRDVAMTPDGKEFYYCVAVGNFGYATILHTKMKDNTWTEPEVVPYMENPNVMNFEPCISPDGQKFFFLSNRADSADGDTVGGDQDIWVMDRAGDEWSKPYNLGAPVNSADEEFFPSVTNDGTLYFTRNKKGSRLSYIYRSKFVNGKYQEPEKLGPQVNSGRTQYNAFIAPDESYIIVPTAGRDDSYGGTDYYISFRNQDDSWLGPINMGDKINTRRGTEYSPFVSRDGKYFFFMSVRAVDDDESKAENLSYQKLWEYHNTPQRGSSDIYWVDTGIIDDLRQKVLNQAK